MPTATGGRRQKLSGSTRPGGLEGMGRAREHRFFHWQRRPPAPCRSGGQCRWAWPAYGRRGAGGGRSGEGVSPLSAPAIGTVTRRRAHIRGHSTRSKGRGWGDTRSTHPPDQTAVVGRHRVPRRRCRRRSRRCCHRPPAEPPFSAGGRYVPSAGRTVAGCAWVRGGWERARGCRGGRGEEGGRPTFTAGAARAQAGAPVAVRHDSSTGWRGEGRRGGGRRWAARGNRTSAAIDPTSNGGCGTWVRGEDEEETSGRPARRREPLQAAPSGARRGGQVRRQWEGCPSSHGAPPISTVFRCQELEPPAVS